MLKESVMAKEYSVVKEVFKTIAKTIIILAIIVVFSSLGFYVINPRFSANVCAQLGWNKAEISCYELLYARNKDNADLYNLIVKLGNVKEYEKQNEYIDKLQDSEDYATFCENMDKSVMDSFNQNKIDGERFYTNEVEKFANIFKNYYKDTEEFKYYKDMKIYNTSENVIIMENKEVTTEAINMDPNSISIEY